MEALELLPDNGTLDCTLAEVQHIHSCHSHISFHIIDLRIITAANVMTESLAGERTWLVSFLHY